MFDYLYYRIYCFCEKYYTDPHASSMGIWGFYVYGSIFFVGIIIFDLFHKKMPLWVIIVWACGYFFGFFLQKGKYTKKVNVLKDRWRDEPPLQHKTRGLLIVLYLIFEVLSIFIFHKIVYGTWTGPN